MRKTPFFSLIVASLFFVGCKDAPTAALDDFDTPITTAASPTVQHADVLVSFSHSFGEAEYVFHDGSVVNESGRIIGSCDEGYFTNHAGQTTGGWNFEHCVTATEGTYVMPYVDAELSFNGRILSLEIGDSEVKYNNNVDKTVRSGDQYLYVGDDENGVLWRMDLDQFHNSANGSGNRFDAPDFSATALTTAPDDGLTAAAYSLDDGETWSDLVYGTMSWSQEATE